MKKFFRLLSIGLVGSWFYYNLLFIYQNFYFTAGSCFQEKTLLFIIPLPGSMDDLSWLLLFGWLLFGFIFGVIQRGAARLFFFYPFFIIAPLFTFYLVKTDTACHGENRCDTQLAKTVESYQRAAFNSLLPDKCEKLNNLQRNCQAAYTFRTAGNCAEIVTKLGIYQEAGIDIAPCQKKLSDCQLEYYQFFYDRLTNEIIIASRECEQKFNKNDRVFNVCALYVAEWQKSGVKPLIK